MLLAGRVFGIDEKIFLGAVFGPAMQFSGRALCARDAQRFGGIRRRERIELGHVVAIIERRAWRLEKERRACFPSVFDLLQAHDAQLAHGMIRPVSDEPVADDEHLVDAALGVAFLQVSRTKRRGLHLVEDNGELSLCRA